MRRELELLKKDVIRKRYFEDNERYADLLNGYLFGGKQIVKAADLKESDSRAYYGVSSNQNDRDIIKKTAFGVNFVMIGVENQELVHYLMPLRTMFYDVSEYKRQAARIGKFVRNSGEKLTASEYLSRFTKESRLYPCITTVVYYGDDWDGARDLYDLLDLRDIPEEVRQYINHYPIHLLEVKKFKNTENFKTDLKQVFEFIQNSTDKSKLKKLVEADDVYQRLDEDAYDMIACCTNTKGLECKKEEYKRKDGMDMCKAIEDMIEDGRQEGRAEARVEERNKFKKVSILNLKLLELGKYEELKRAQTDEEYRESLLVGYGLV